ncbi:hypothetical protein Scep_015002 [Stephania cephalantha]|uniref:Uncharacterized protein n=1 Tax=Stephania cephalantha TaxID=152367 RepID=A0AAP0J282_9MAGN
MVKVSGRSWFDEEDNEMKDTTVRYLLGWIIDSCRTAHGGDYGWKRKDSQYISSMGRCYHSGEYERSSVLREPRRQRIELGLPRSGKCGGINAVDPIRVYRGHRMFYILILENYLGKMLRLWRVSKNILVPHDEGKGWRALVNAIRMEGNQTIDPPLRELAVSVRERERVVPIREIGDPPINSTHIIELQ